MIKPEYLKMARMSKTMLLIINRIVYSERANASEIKSIMVRWKDGKIEYEKLDKWVYAGNQHTAYSRDGWFEDVEARNGAQRTHVFIERTM